MPVIRNSDLPAFARIRSEGALVLPEHDQVGINIGLINMMPDAALNATERQFIRLLALCHQTVRFYPFNLEGIQRSHQGQQHIDSYYFKLNQFIQKSSPIQLHGLIISGTNVPTGDMSESPFWQELCRLFQWIEQYAMPTLFTCLATHAAMQYFYQQKRQRLKHKCWGVYEHQKLIDDHPMLTNLADTIKLPHSRFNTITADQFRQAKIDVLLESEQVGVHLAQCRTNPFTFFQGHPEYDYNSLLKEYQRELKYFLSKQRCTYPPLPENYFDAIATEQLQTFQQHLLALPESQRSEYFSHSFEEDTLSSPLNNTWLRSASSMIKNWLNQISP